jgi:hypothetical protein
MRAGRVEQICAVSAAVWNDWRTVRKRREQGIRRLLEHLDRFHGDDWQTRWAASSTHLTAGAVRQLTHWQDRAPLRRGD